MKPILRFLAVLLLAPLAALHADEHLIQPGDNPQDVMDRAAPGDRIVFQSGLHLHHPGKHRALLYEVSPEPFNFQGFGSGSAGLSIPTPQKHGSDDTDR